LEVWFEIVRTEQGPHDRNCRGKGTIERPTEALGCRREENINMIALKLFERAIETVVEMA
jgi:hypothetical protein